MADFNLGTARGSIEIDYNGNSSAKQARNDIDSIGQAGDKAGPHLNKVATGAAVAGAGIVAGFALAIKTAGDFEKGLSGISAVSGATTGQMDAVRKKALQLGADTAFSASDAASAMEELVKAGISIPDVMNGAADATVALAAAGGVDLPVAATIAANAMNQFGLSAEQMPMIADKIAGAANASAIDVTDFGHSMSQVGAVAKLTGLSFEDTALAITAMGNAGIKGSDAGTSLKTFLSNLQPTTEKQTGLMEELGLMTKEGGNQFFDAAGKVKSMSDIAGVLGGALKGMSDAQKTATLGTLFGSDAIRAAAVIAGTGAKGMDKLTASIDKTKAADVAKVRLGNMAGGVEALKGSAETFAIQIGTVLIPMMTNIIRTVTGIINKFVQMDEGTKKLIVIVGLFIASFLLIISAAIKVSQAITAVKITMEALKLTFLASPIFWIIMAIVALIAAFVLLYKNNEAFRNFVNAMWAGIKAAIAATVSWITGAAVPWIVNAWNTIVNATKSLWAGIVGVWNAIVSGITTAVNAVKAVVSAVFAAIVFVITTYINIWLTIITTVLNAIVAIWNAVWGLFGPLVMAVFGLIVAVVQLGMRAVRLVVSTVLNWIKTAWSAAWNAVSGVAKVVWGAIVKVITAAVNAVKAVVTRVFNAVKAVVTMVFNAIRSVATTVWNAISNAISGPINRAKAIVTSVVNAIKSAVGTAFNAAKTLAVNAFSAMYSAVSSKVTALRNKVSGVVSSIRGFFSGAGSWLTNAGRQIIQGLIDGIRAMVDKVGGAISSVTAKIKGFLPGSPIKEGPLVSWNRKGPGGPGAMLVDFLAAGIASNLGSIEKAFSGLSADPSYLSSPNVALNASTARTGASSVSRAPVAPSSRPPITVEFKNYNPVAERSSVTAVREMTRIGALGVFG